MLIRQSFGIWLSSKVGLQLCAFLIFFFFRCRASNCLLFLCVAGISIAGEKDITPEMLVKNLETVLRLLPEPESDDHWIDLPEIRESARPSSSRFIDQASAPLEEELENVVTSTGGGRTLSEEAQAFGAKTINHSASKDEDSSEHEDLCKSSVQHFAASSLPDYYTQPALTFFSNQAFSATTTRSIAFQ